MTDPEPNDTTREVTPFCRWLTDFDEKLHQSVERLPLPAVPDHDPVAWKRAASLVRLLHEVADGPVEPEPATETPITLPHSDPDAPPQRDSATTDR